MLGFQECGVESETRAQGSIAVSEVESREFSPSSDRPDCVPLGSCTRHRVLVMRDRRRRRSRDAQRARLLATPKHALQFADRWDGSQREEFEYLPRIGSLGHLHQQYACCTARIHVQDWAFNRHISI